MKDSIFLILSALGCAGLAALFWRFLGQNGFDVISSIAMVVLAVDNIRLRRLSKAKSSE